MHFAKSAQGVWRKKPGKSREYPAALQDVCIPTILLYYNTLSPENQPLFPLPTVYIGKSYKIHKK